VEFVIFTIAEKQFSSASLFSNDPIRLSRAHIRLFHADSQRHKHAYLKKYPPFEPHENPFLNSDMPSRYFDAGAYKILE
jgi:hypothetical protein